MFLKILQYSKENTCAGVFFCKVADTKLQFYLKNQIQHRCLPVKIEKFLRTAFLYETSGGFTMFLPKQLHRDIAKATCCF